MYRCVNLLRVYFVHLIFEEDCLNKVNISAFSMHILLFILFYLKKFHGKKTDCTFYKLTPIFLEEHISCMSPPFIKRVNLLLNWNALTYKGEKAGF